MKNLSDEYIMQKIKQGNLDYLKQIFEQYNNQVLNYFFRMTFNYEDSRDLTQSLFYRVLKYRKSFRLDMKFKHWLYKMARNITNDYFNKKKNYVNIQENKNSLLNNENKEAEKDKLLFKAIEKLPDEYKELLILSRFCNYKQIELAEIYDTTVASIKNKLYRALIKLKEIYFQTELN